MIRRPLDSPAGLRYLMRFMDRILQKWRARVARPWVPATARVLDIGCHQGELLQSLRDHIFPSVGYDPLTAGSAEPHSLIAAIFPEPSPYPDGSVAVVVMLATLEHLHDNAPL